MFSQLCFKRLWFDFIFFFYRCLIQIKWVFAVFNWMIWIIIIKTKMIFSVIIMFFDEKTVFWPTAILSERSLKITWIMWFSLRVLLRALMRISLFALILQSEIITITTTLIKVLTLMLNLLSIFLELLTDLVSIQSLS